MKNIFYEMKKSWFKLPILLILIVLTAVNFYKFYSDYRIYGFMVWDNAELAKKVYYHVYEDNLKGEINEKKINYVIENCDELESISEKNDDEFARYVAFNWYIASELEYAVTYKNFSDKIANKAKENIYFYLEHENRGQAAVNRLIYDLYSGREVKNYRLTSWVDSYFEHDFSSLLILIMIIIGLSNCFSIEYGSGMNVLIKSVRKTGKTVNAKIFSMFIYILFLTVFFTITDLLITNYFIKIDGLNEPIYSAEIFKFSPLKCSFESAILICTILKFLSFLVFGGIVCIISIIIKNSVFSVCLSFGTVAAFIGFTEKSKTIFNPINILSPCNFIKEFSYITFFEIPIQTVIYIAVIYSLICIFIIVTIKLLTKERRRKNVKI